MTTQKFNIYDHITDQIIKAIEEGCAPWRKPWTGDTIGASLPLRHNGEAYRGINTYFVVYCRKGWVHICAVADLQAG